MKKAVFVLAMLGLLLPLALAQAETGNLAPNGAHYNLNIIAVPQPKTAPMDDSNGHTIFVPISGKIIINGREQEVYFARPTLRLIINQVFDVTDRKGQYDVEATVKGGGLSGQAGAIRHGISRALCKLNAEYRPVLKKAGFMTRDARAVERKKYGRPGARKRFQFSKR